MEPTAWPAITAAIADSPYPVEVLPVDNKAATACLARLGMTARSWLGAVVANAGGLLVDHGWLRVLGSGHGRLLDVAAAADVDAQLLIVGYDVMGGHFGWFQAKAGTEPTVHYFGPDDLAWQVQQGRGHRGARWSHRPLIS